MKFKVAFYQIEKDDRAVFCEMLEKVGRLADDESRGYVRPDGNHLRVSDVSYRPDEIYGHAVKIRMKSLPDIAGIDGASEPLRLGKNRGLGDESAFLYVKRSGILLLQKSRSFITAKVFVEYLKHLSSIYREIEPLPLLRRSAWEKLSGASEFKKLVIAVARPEIIATEKNLALRTIGVLQHEFNSATVEFTVGMSRNGGGLNSKSVAKTIKRLLASDACETTKLKVSVKDGEEPVEFIDLLEDRYVVEGDLNSGKSACSFETRGLRQQLLASMWAKERADILRHYN